MPALDYLMAFNIADANASLWVSRGPRGPAALPPTYPAKWAGLTDGLIVTLKQTVLDERANIEDVQAFGLLATAEEGGAMKIATDETHAGILTAAVAQQMPGRRVRDATDLFNSAFYVIKLVHEEQVIYAVRKTDSVWKTKNALNVRTIVFRENELALDEEPRFDIATNIDFFIVGDEILILNKRHFESILRYKQAHREDFAELQAEAEFQNIFTDLAPLVGHVGENKIQLRRASSIRQKGHYRNQDFMDRLRARGAEFGFNIAFGDDGKIIVTPETCAEIMTALLDHRLSSAFSTNIYDVQNTVTVFV